jgi:hypothetical protein
VDQSHRVYVCVKKTVYGAGDTYESHHRYVIYCGKPIRLRDDNYGWPCQHAHIELDNYAGMEEEEVLQRMFGKW